MSNDLTQVAVGSDMFTAQIILEACRADGLTVELLGTSTGAQPGFGSEQYLLVRTEDLPAVQAIIADSA